MQDSGQVNGQWRRRARQWTDFGSMAIFSQWPRGNCWMSHCYWGGWQKQNIINKKTACLGHMILFDTYFWHTPSISHPIYSINKIFYFLQGTLLISFSLLVPHYMSPSVPTYGSGIKIKTQQQCMAALNTSSWCFKFRKSTKYILQKFWKEDRPHPIGSEKQEIRTRTAGKQELNLDVGLDLDYEPNLA